MRRIEVEELEEGDVFEYEHDRLRRLVRDTVRAGPDFVPKEQRRVVETHRKFFKNYGELMTSVYTEHGENAHGYVTLPARTVVILIEKGSDS